MGFALLNKQFRDIFNIATCDIILFLTGSSFVKWMLDIYSGIEQYNRIHFTKHLLTTHTLMDLE